MEKTVYAIKLTSRVGVETYRGLYLTVERARSAAKDFAQLGYLCEIVLIRHG